MTSALEDKYVAMAARLIAKFPATAVLTTRTGATYNPATGNTSGEVATSTTLTVSIPLNVEQSYVDGDVVAREDQLTYAASDDLGSVVPRLGDRILIGSTQYTILRVFPIKVGSVVAAYGLAVRA
jgi:hypothetical protein